MLNDYTNPLLLRWLYSFVFTLLVEVPIYIYVSRKPAGNGKPVSIYRTAAVAALASLITHPLLWFGRSFFDCDYITYVAFGEPMVALTEAFVFFRLLTPVRFSRALAASFLANAASFGGGILLRYL